MEKAETNLSKEEFGRLPKKAQREINRVLANYNFLVEQLSETKKGETSVYIRSTLDTRDERTYLPNGTRVYFTGEHGTVEVGVDGNRNIRARTSEGRIVVFPDSSNTIHLEEEQRT